ncbi:MAG: hypothetical protein JWR39_1555 [Devosia sp.]|jgi:hypothetical protein|nr:hypothetical protein [Devosia sp.]
MSKSLHKGVKVTWNWGGNTAEGTIVERFTDKVSRTIKGTEVTRNASPAEPAFLIEQEDGDEVLKSASELEAK